MSAARRAMLVESRDAYYACADELDAQAEAFPIGHAGLEHFLEAKADALRHAQLCQDELDKGAA
jgi:hypothetical protein